MSEENNANVTTPAEPTAPATEPAGDATNSDFKSTPAYQAMAKQIAEMKKAEADRLAAEQAKQQEAQRKELEAKGEYEKVIEMHKKQLEDMQKQHAADILQRDLKTALIQSGASNDTFISGAIAGYKEGDVHEYVQELAANEANKPFFGQQQQVGITPPPGGNIGGKGNVIKDLESYKAALRSDDPKVVQAAKQWGMDYLSKNLKI